MSNCLILFKYPLGLGYGNYVLYYPKILEQGYEIANNLFVNLFGLSLSYSEILEIITTGHGIAAKAAVLSTIILSGWVGLIFWLIIFRNSLKYIKRLNIENTKMSTWGKI
jgi:hypothetical protein